ncbi:hypothetical protein N0V85_009487 [Neurospora sp. IMI 360204]|nr:hypothetical protein N0V85_009487 [Neurospora sp. IMI 360204]
MAPGFLSRTCPVELLLEIFKQLPSTQDALSFALTCRHINDVWDRNATSILLALWRRNGEFPAVEEALIAARMTKVVVEAEQADCLPPTDMRPGDFSINHGGAPTVSELKAARALYHLARALSVAFCHHNAYLHERRVFKDGSQTSGPPERTPEKPSRMPEWSARVHKAIYRTMIAGAALAGIYNEPLFKAKTHSDARIRRLARVKEQGEEPDDLFYGDGALALEEFFAFLHDFPSNYLGPSRHGW